MSLFVAYFRFKPGTNALGTLAVSSSYTQAPSGTLALRLAGPTNFGALGVAGQDGPNQLPQLDGIELEVGILDGDDRSVRMLESDANRASLSPVRRALRLGARPGR